VLLEPPSLLETGGVLDVCEAAAAVPLLVSLEVNEPEPSTDVGVDPLLPVSLVEVPSMTSGLDCTKGDVVDVIPGQLVLPMTVTVDG
jgi:hypothetical protein